MSEHPPVIFLDFDGVLNDHKFSDAAQSCSLCPACVLRFNWILEQTGAAVVISSSWRYLIHGGAMTLDGFGYMLRTHGVSEKLKIIGITRKDTSIEDGANRGEQISEWLVEHPEIKRYVVLDDSDLGITRAGHPFVQTAGDTGLTDEDARRVIELLNAEPTS